jgi:hypothetical protein
MVAIDSQQPMLSQMVEHLLIPMQELECGGKHTLIADIGSQELEFSIEETAVDKDSQEPRYSLEMKNVVKLRLEPKMVNGTQLIAKNQCMETELNWLQHKEPIFQFQELKSSLVKKVKLKKIVNLKQDLLDHLHQSSFQTHL